MALQETQKEMVGGEGSRRLGGSGVRGGRDLEIRLEKKRRVVKKKGVMPGFLDAVTGKNIGSYKGERRAREVEKGSDRRGSLKRSLNRMEESSQEYAGVCCQTEPPFSEIEKAEGVGSTWRIS